ncbi:MAG: metal ABC transporter permease [Syntrophaceae bacterium]|nr:metal ABC transporter permease [Syntrophaceae bacterium]
MHQFLTDLRSYEFLQNALLASILVSSASGVIGPFVVVRRISYLAGSISHTVLGGIGAVIFFNTLYPQNRIDPLWGAAFTALLSALIIGLVSLHAKQREDTVIGAMWAIGMALGIVFIAKTPGYTSDLMGYLFGNILMVTEQDLYLLVILDILILGAVMLFYNQFLAVCFDEEFASLRGLNIDIYYLSLLAMTALTVVGLVTVVGIVMCIALLTLPAAIASLFSNSLWKIMLMSTLLSVLFTSSGLIMSYLPDIPPGATTILLAGGTYLLALVFKKVSSHGSILRRH